LHHHDATLLHFHINHTTHKYKIKHTQSYASNVHSTLKMFKPTIIFCLNLFSMAFASGQILEQAIKLNMWWTNDCSGRESADGNYPSDTCLTFFGQKSTKIQTFAPECQSKPYNFGCLLICIFQNRKTIDGTSWP
jgi:hypothetical protein